MAKSKATTKGGLKPEAVLAYVLHRSGVPISEICKTVHKKKTVIHDWIEHIKKLVETPIPMSEFKAAVTGLIPLNIKSFIHLIKTKDVHTVNNFMNKTIFADVKDSESKSYTSIINLGLGDALRGINLSRIDRIIEILRNRTDASEATPVVPGRLPDSSREN